MWMLLWKWKMGCIGQCGPFGLLFHFQCDIHHIHTSKLLIGSCKYFYREGQLDWVDFDFGCSAVGLVLLRLIGNWQNWLSSWARW